MPRQQPGGLQKQGGHSWLGGAGARAPAGSKSVPKPVDMGLGGWRPLPDFAPSLALVCRTEWAIPGPQEDGGWARLAGGQRDGHYASSQVWTRPLQPALKRTPGPPRNCEPGVRSLTTGARGAQQRPSPSLEDQEGGLPGGGDISGRKKMKRTEPFLRRSLTGGKLLRVPLPGPRPGTPRAHQALPQPLPGGSPPGLRACARASPSASVPFPRDEPQHVRGRDTPSMTTQDVPTTS